MFGLAFVALLVLQIVGFAGAFMITARATLPTSTGSVRTFEGGTDRMYCDDISFFYCDASSYCMVESPNLFNCCQNGMNCVGWHTCLDHDAYWSMAYTGDGAYLGCYDSLVPSCVTSLDTFWNMTQYTCGATNTVHKAFFSAQHYDDLISTIGKDAPFPITSKPGLTTSSSTLASDPEQTASNVTLASQPGQTGSIVTVTVAQTQTAVPKAATTTPPHPHSGHQRAKTVGIAVGAVAGLCLVIIGVWFVWRRHRRHANLRNPHHAAQQDPTTACPHELQHDPKPKAELHDSSPRPDIGTIGNPGELPSPPPVYNTRQPSPVTVCSPSPTTTTFSAPPSELSTAPPSEHDPAPAHGIERSARSVRYGPSGFLSPEFAMRDGLWNDSEDERKHAGPSAN